jgi:hypothetical protein
MASNESLPDDSFMFHDGRTVSLPVSGPEFIVSSVIAGGDRQAFFDIIAPGRPALTLPGMS